MATTAEYPRPRPGRIGGVPVGAPVAANPTVRLWPFHFLEASGVNILVSPSFRGPAVLDELIVEIPQGSPLPFTTFGLYYATDSGNGGSGQALNTVPTGTPIFENLTFQRDDANVSTDARGFNTFNMNEANIGFQRLPLRYLITLASFFVKLRTQNATAATNAMWGYLRVLEAVPPEQVPNFL